MSVSQLHLTQEEHGWLVEFHRGLDGLEGEGGANRGLQLNHVRCRRDTGVSCFTHVMQT